MSSQADRSLAEALNAASQLSQFRQTLDLNPQLLQTLSSLSDITILAPSDTAFSKVDNATISSLASNQSLMTACCSTMA